MNSLEDYEDTFIDPEDLYYAAAESNRRLPKEQEALLFGDLWTAFYYARDVIKGRWPELESYILQDPLLSYEYAMMFIGRWPEAEEIIKSDPFAAYKYAMNVLQKRWPEAEPYILQCPNSAAYYARDVIKGRWSEAENIIRQDKSAAEYYARYVIVDDTA